MDGAGAVEPAGLSLSLDTMIQQRKKEVPKKKVKNNYVVGYRKPVVNG